MGAVPFGEIAPKVYSNASDILTITIPGQLPGLGSFRVRPWGTNFELLWQNNGVTGSEIVIDYINTTGTTYQNACVLPEYETDYHFTPSIRGVKYKFKAYRRNNMGISDPSYDYIYASYRDASQDSDIYITRLSYTGNPESWINGRPEFYLKMVEQSPSGDTLFVQNRVDMPVKDGNVWLYGEDEKVFAHRWRITDNIDRGWYSTLVFALYEEDYALNMKNVQVEANLAYKDSTDLSASIHASAEFEIKRNDEECGSTYIRYFENPQRTLSFPRYGVTISIE